MVILLILLLLLQNVALLFSFSISTAPLCSVYTQNSILERKENYRPLLIGARKRWATCTGATWFHDDYLATLNLYGNKITTYKFCSHKNQFQILQEIDSTADPLLIKPENLVASPDGTLLAICSGFPNAGIKIYEIDASSHFITPKPLLDLRSKNFTHNIRFSPDGNWLATATFGDDEAICIYKITKNFKSVQLTRVYQKPNLLNGLSAKAINFTKDGKFAVIVYCPKEKGPKSKLLHGLILIHRFNTNEGALGELICSLDDKTIAFSYEDAAFIDNDRFIIFSDQHNDRIAIHAFRPESGILDKNFFCIHGDLSFPHGIGVKQDGKYFVVTNYGDDKFNLYPIPLLRSEPLDATPSPS